MHIPSLALPVPHASRRSLESMHVDTATRHWGGVIIATSIHTAMHTLTSAYLSTPTHTVTVFCTLHSLISHACSRVKRHAHRASLALAAHMRLVLRSLASMHDCVGTATLMGRHDYHHIYPNCHAHTHLCAFPRLPPTHFCTLHSLTSCLLSTFT